MTELQQFMDECTKRGAASLHDHLTLSGFTDDYNKRKSMAFQAARALAEDDRYQKMLGTIIFPSPDTRAGWAKGTDSMEDQLPRPVFNTSLVLSSTVGSMIAKDDWRFQATDAALRSAVKAVATASNRTQEIVANGFVRHGDELDYAREKADNFKRQAEEAAKEVAYLREQNRILLSLVPKRGTDIAPTQQ